MKKTLLPLLTGIALTATVYAGPYSLPKGPIPVAPPIETPCIWTWFAGGSAGYATGDWDEDIYTTHFGVQVKCNDYSHAFYLEVGYTEKDNLADHSKTAPPADFLVKMDTDIIPITLNYKFEAPITDKWSWYAGVGAGIALVNVDIANTEKDPAKGGGQKVSESDTAFYAHIFAGVIFKVSSSFELFGGVRYIYMDDPDLGLFSDISKHATLDDALHFELGGRFKF